MTYLRAQPDAWWQAQTAFFDATRTRAWIFAPPPTALRAPPRRTHHISPPARSAHPSVYGPTADTGDKVIYRFE
jgi:hypothetical protein